MKNNNLEIWVGANDNDPSFVESVNKEFTELPIIDALSESETLDLGSNRRDFLKYLGFGLGAATIAAGCDIPIKRAIPYVVKPDTIVPGIANYYASSFVKGGDYCSILVKTREGRPIKIEGNALSEVTKGGTSARVQASVLDLYDINRLTGPKKVADDGSAANISWEDLDKEIKGKLSPESNIAIITNTILSPTTKGVLAGFSGKYPNTKVVVYDPVSSSAMLEANEANFGYKMIPNYHFGKADVIVSLGADFLGTWISPIEYAGQYASKRKIKDINGASMSLHIQVESGMTMTGSNADNRILIKPSEQGAAIATLYNEVAALTGGEKVSAPSINPKAAQALKAAAKELAANKGKSLVISGSNNVGEQILINKTNDLLSNYGATIGFLEASLQRQGVDKDIQSLIADMDRGSINTVFIMDGANPAYDLPNAGAFSSALAKVGTRVSFSGMPSETTAVCNYIAPNHNLFESWGDAEAKRGHYSLIQPTISPLFKTRQAEETLLAWSDNEGYDRSSDQPYYEYLKKFWWDYMFINQTDYATFQSFWDNALHGGVFVVPQDASLLTNPCNADVQSAAAKINKPSGSEFEISFYEPINVGAGQYANNPWLQELPDPVTRCTWGNYISVPVEWDGNSSSFKGYQGIGKDVAKGKAEFVDVEVNGVTSKFTALAQFGQAPGTISTALGYGRTNAGLSAKGIGTNVNPWLSLDANGNTKYYADVASLKVTGVDKEYACVQYHHTMGVTSRGADGKIVKDAATGKPFNVDEKELGISGYQGSLTDRSVIFNANLGELKEKTEELHRKREEYQHLNRQTLYFGHDNKYNVGHHWGMFIDLNSCIGCGTCSVACMAENNVPVVGKKEVSRHHEMSWLRIDRYFYGDVSNPNVVYQPLMCQHCDNAPCENVCPVAATNHSAEGLNQMAYNRCIGTRYCANNCPYKVRRFNWLDYTTADLFPKNEYDKNGEEVPYGADNLTRMVLNPDVTVRSRGVIEKCSFCVQRIQEGKLTAKREGRGLRDNDVKTACQTACPTGAIVFGDVNNKEGQLAKELKNPLIYRVIEEVNTESSVRYTMKVNNRREAIDQAIG